ncbi:MAG: PIN domain-containing protein [bacterium]|nr:PIN domain-containing protein [bacterium]
MGRRRPQYGREGRSRHRFHRLGPQFVGQRTDRPRFRSPVRFEWYLSPFILQETAGVLQRKFGWEGESLARILAALRNGATLLDPDRIPPVVEGNEADNRILACAVEASADYLVTGDRRHLLPLGRIEGVRIVNAPVFLNSLGE